MKRGQKFKKYIYEFEFEERVQYEMDKCKIAQSIKEIIAEFERQYGQNVTSNELLIFSSSRGIKEVKLAC